MRSKAVDFVEGAVALCHTGLQVQDTPPRRPGGTRYRRAGAKGMCNQGRTPCLEVEPRSAFLAEGSVVALYDRPGPMELERLAND